MQADALDLSDAVKALAQRIAALPPGQLAELRRASDPAGSATFWRLWHEISLPYGDKPWEKSWESVMQAIAILTPTGREEAKASAHDGRHAFGRALLEAGVSDLRFSRLLTASPVERRRTLLRLTRMLAREEWRCDLRPLARLILFDRAEKEKRNLAREYYAAKAAADKAKDTAPDA